MSGYEMGLDMNPVLSMVMIAGSLAAGCYCLYQGIVRKRVLLIVFGSIGIGLGFLQWMIGFSLAVVGACLGFVGIMVNEKERSDEK